LPGQEEHHIDGNVPRNQKYGRTDLLKLEHCIRVGLLASSWEFRDHPFVDPHLRFHSGCFGSSLLDVSAWRISTSTFSSLTV